MRDKPRFEAHGAFAVKYEEDYALNSVSGSWNLACAEIFNSLIRKRVTLNKPDLKRCLIVDGREWGLETPDCGEKIRELNQFLSGYFKALYIAYVLSPENMHLAKFILDSNNKGFNDIMIWRFFTDFRKAVSWLRSEGFTLPDLEASDFPEPIPAEEYLKYLS